VHRCSTALSWKLFDSRISINLKQILCEILKSCPHLVFEYVSGILRDLSTDFGNDCVLMSQLGTQSLSDTNSIDDDDLMGDSNVQDGELEAEVPPHFHGYVADALILRVRHLRQSSVKSIICPIR
jgi:hypothetical protein